MRTAALALFASSIAASLAAILPAAAVSQLAPCTFEDGSSSPIPCVWNGAERGNGIGDTIIITRKP